MDGREREKEKDRKKAMKKTATATEQCSQSKMEKKRNVLDKQTAEVQRNWDIRRDRRAKITTCFAT